MNMNDLKQWVEDNLLNHKGKVASSKITKNSTCYKENKDVFNLIYSITDKMNYIKKQSDRFYFILNTHKLKFYDINTKDGLKKYLEDTLIVNDKIDGQKLNPNKQWSLNNKIIINKIKEITKLCGVDDITLRVRLILDNMYEMPKCEYCKVNEVEMSYDKKPLTRCIQCRRKQSTESMVKQKSTSKKNNRKRKERNLKIKEFSNISKDELKIFIESLKDSKNGYSTSKIRIGSMLHTNNVEIFNLIVKETSFLPEDAKMSERLWCVENDLYSRPLCPYCNTNELVYDPHKKYDKCCSNSCAQKYHHLKKKPRKFNKKHLYDIETNMYYVKVSKDDNVVWKIGISAYDVESRFSYDLKNGCEIEIIKLWKCANRKVAFREEAKILDEFKKYKYYGEDILYCGNTELFNIDINKVKELNPLLV